MVKKNENNLKPEDVSIYYFKRTTEKFEVTKHTIDSEGKLNPIFPSGFYDNSYTLVKELL
ncbi:hypothetical protein SDC9_124086 [bioreactor metagenome]|uniref:DUF3696 domain-containing protein n=1 Tax=bioreactor metagenome TaxID=1076179 RepID=A0A645CJG0_9ZZZZ